MKKFFLSLALIAGIFLFSFPALSKATVVVELFDDRLCPVCAATKDYINQLEEEGLEIRVYSINNSEKLKEVAEAHGIEDYKVVAPTIFIGDNFFQFSEFGPRQEEMIDRAVKGEKVETGLVVTIPFIKKEVDVSNWSLPLITIVLGSLDGVNICSISALILVLSIVMVFDSRKKILLFGGLFILTASLIYGVMIFTWGRVFEAFIGQLEALRLIVGLLTFAGGVYFTTEFIKSRKENLTCQGKDSKMTVGAMKKLKDAFEAPGKKTTSLMIGSVILFAAVVTLVDLPCSIGLPIAYTGVLIERGLSLTAYTLYILAYLFFYTLIALIVFVGAVFTKKIWFASPKIVTWVTFIGAVVLYYLAYYYLFK